MPYLSADRSKKMPKNKISKEKSIRRTKTLTELFVCCIILASAGYVVKNGIDNMQSVPSSQNTDNSGYEIEIPEPTEPDPNKIVFVSVPFNTKDKFSGNLILVNNQHEYFSSENENLVSIMEKNDETERSFFTSVDYTYTILEPVYEPMAQMIEDFYEIYENDTLIIYGSYRTKDFQQQLYDNFTASQSDDEAPIVAMPGFSEHETGYAFDFSEIINYDYQGTGDFEWLNTNCYKYGFIIRYAEDKENITEYRYEPWHFRYVGIPHATFMTRNNICFEEYINLLRMKYPYEGEHLQLTDDDGANYEIYFVASDDSSEITNVPVPTGVRYDISGNNVDGFIITVHIDEKVNFGEENPTITTATETDISETETTTTTIE